MAIREDRVYKLDEFGQNQLIQNEFGRSEIDNLSLGGSGGGSTGGGGGGGSVLAFDPYTSPYIQPRIVAFTINTFANLSRQGVLAKAFLDGVEIENQTISKGRVTFTLNEQRLLNPSILTLVSGDLKPQKYFLIQCRKDAENEVSIIEIDSIGDRTPTEGTPTPTGEGFAGNGTSTTPVNTGGGFGGGGGGTGERFERDFGSGYGREVVVSGDLSDRQNIQ